MKAVNEERGEVAIHLGGNDFVMLPTFQAICEIESASGKTISKLIREFQAGDISVQTWAIVLSACLTAGGEYGVTYKKVGDMIMEAGMSSPELLRATGQLLRNALQGGVKPGEPKAAKGDRT